MSLDQAENEEIGDSFRELHSNVHIFVNSIGKQKERQDRYFAQESKPLLACSSYDIMSSELESVQISCIYSVMKLIINMKDII